ncbi:MULTISPECIES: cytochrome C [Bacillus]|uniref:cytochrome C n=1 Tax=Bacillus TaxID=1386 RepID=UPI000C758812|nr:MULTISPECIES: cytochrome C [Bacillus]PLR85544.1 cytochrome C [Bacillus sp. V33-4]RSK57568.1 cytochrome C [Bacillus canaveralius]
MQKAAASFVIFALLGLGLGYLVFDVFSGKTTDTPESTAPTEQQEEASSKGDNAANSNPDSEGNKEEETVAAEGNILQTKGCLGCHSAASLDLKGGATGPDLSQAFSNVEGKHGKPLQEFLKEPTSAVMSGVISGNPLTDEEISQIAELLKQASEK